ncbi:MAG: ribonuclease P protein component [Acidimicrobiia bacterium]
MIGRIQDRTTFQRFRTDARRARAGELWCAALLDDAAAPPRIAYAIGRGVGSAVVRNRLRRRLKAIAVANADIVHPGSYLIGARSGAATCSFEELNAMFITLFDQVGARGR